MERRAIAIRGTVQGVGFRPFVYNLASSLALGGFVRNQTGGVTIEVEGDEQSLETFVARLVSEPPPLARIEAWSCEARAVRGESRFHIEHSETSPAGAVSVTPDAGTCDACLAELFNPRDRRYRYPFLNCTNCGPRLTIVTGVPYDRQRTTMAGFPMCPRCRAEYDDPTDRRFHAQPTACADCGPALALTDRDGKLLETSDPLALFVSALREGKIGAMKGLGGYHLVCDASNFAAVSELRRRKHRYEKPLAVMLGMSGGQWSGVSGRCRELLTSPRRPIVLLPKQQFGGIVDEVAPGNPLLGVMLPYTPLHHLLLHDMGGVPLVMTSGNQSDEPIAFEDRDAFARLGGIADVFLTHNRPIHVRCDDSVTRVIGKAESPIRRSRGYAPQPVPLPMSCPAPILAVGGQMKSTFALGSDCRAVLSHHAGDLDHFEAYRAFARDIEHYEKLFGLRPTIIAHDMHPDYASTRYARGRQAESREAASDRQTDSIGFPSSLGTPGEGRGGGQGLGAPLEVDGHKQASACRRRERSEEPALCLPKGSRPSAKEEILRCAQDDGLKPSIHFQSGIGSGAAPAVHPTGVRLVAVQHHHAHMASCMAEHGLAGPVIGVTFDGSGYGTDGAIWGGEFLVGGYDRFDRAAHLRYVAMPGGEQAVREPWRMAAAHLQDAASPCPPFERRFPGPKLATLKRMIERRLNSPMTSSAGRLFDAVASLAGLRDRVRYEGQAAIELEWLAESTPAGTGCGVGRGEPYPFALDEPPASRPGPLEIDTRTIISSIAAEVACGVFSGIIARRFHSTLVEIIAEVCRRIRMTTQLQNVVLSGGVFMNALLTVETEQRLRQEGFKVFRHELVPPNDGGLCLGQVAVAASITQS